MLTRGEVRQDDRLPDQSPVGRRVRTNNHVERTNRRLRFLEKVRYKWRRRRTLVRFVVMTLDRWRQNDQGEIKESAPKPGPMEPPSAGQSG